MDMRKVFVVCGCGRFSPYSAVRRIRAKPEWGDATAVPAERCPRLQLLLYVSDRARLLSFITAHDAVAIKPFLISWPATSCSASSEGMRRKTMGKQCHTTTRIVDNRLSVGT